LGGAGMFGAEGVPGRDGGAGSAATWSGESLLSSAVARSAESVSSHGASSSRRAVPSSLVAEAVSAPGLKPFLPLSPL